MSFTNTQTRGLPCAYAHNSIMQALTLPLTVLLLLVVFLLLCESLSLSPLSALQLLRGHVTSFLSTSHLLHLFLLLLLLAIYCPPPSPAYLLLLSSLTFLSIFSPQTHPPPPPPTNPTLSPPQTALSVVFFPLFILQPSSFWLALMGGWRGGWKGMSTRREGGCRVMKGRVCDLSSVCV